MPKILIVDNDELSSSQLKDICAAQKLRVETCADSDAALDRVQVEQPDLVIIDANVAGPDGFELCRRIRESEQEDRHTTIVVLTSRDDTASKLVALSMGVDDYLVKPIDAREMASRIARWLDRRAHQAGIVLLRRREAIREVVATLCHEINNPLQAAVLGVDMARAHLDKAHPGAANLKLVADHLGRIHDILMSLQEIDETRTVPYIGQARMLDIRSAKAK